MSPHRVYLPTTPLRLRAALGEGALGSGALLARAVTGAARAADPSGDEEQWEFAALGAAAQESLVLLSSADPPLRVVVAADVPELSWRAGSRPDEHDPTAVTVPGPVPVAAWVAVHADDSGAHADVAAARDALASPGSSTPEAGDEILERCLAHDLGWYGVQELPTLVAAWASP